MQAVLVGHKRTGKERMGNLRVQRFEQVKGVVGEVGVEALHLLCWVQTELEEEGRPWHVDSSRVVGEVACYGRTLMVGASEELQSGMVVGEEADRLCLMEEEEHPHGMEVAGEAGCLVGPGWGAGGQCDFVEVEGLEQRDWSLAQEAEAPVCQVEEEVHQLWGSREKMQLFRACREQKEGWSESPPCCAALLTASIPPCSSMAL